MTLRAWPLNTARLILFMVTPNGLPLTELFLLAMQDILKAQQIVGGRIVVVECKNDDKLRKFYEETLGFQLIDTADDESMLKYMTMISAYQ